MYKKAWLKSQMKAYLLFGLIFVVMAVGSGVILSSVSGASKIILLTIWGVLGIERLVYTVICYVQMQRTKPGMEFVLLADIPENEDFIITGMPPFSLFSADRPLLLSAVYEHTPDILHDPRLVETYYLMLTDHNEHDGNIGLGDKVRREGNTLKQVKFQAIKYELREVMTS